MKKTILHSVLAALCLFGSAAAQDMNRTKPLQNGDSLPPLTFTKLVNSKQQTISTSDHKDQLLIIDFWATWCSSCIKMFPAVEALQKRYQGKVQFLAVNSWAGDTKEKLTPLFARHPEWTFPSVYADTMLSRLLPHKGIPFYAWIKNGRLIATTGTEAIDADTIAKALNGDFRPTTRIPIELKLNRPIFLAGNGGEPERYTYRSLLTPSLPGVGTSIWRSINEAGLADRYLFVNVSIYQLISAAYPVLGLVNKNRILTGEGVDPGILQDSSSTMRNAKKRVTYEAIFPPRPPQDALRLMQQDMHRYLGLTVDSAIIERETLVFSNHRAAVKKNNDKPPGKPETNWYTAEQNIPITLRNYPLDEALQLFDETSELPVQNETTINPVIDLQLKATAVNETELRAALKRYGIELKRERRKFLVYVIRPYQPLSNQ